MIDFQSWDLVMPRASRPHLPSIRQRLQALLRRLGGFVRLARPRRKATSRSLHDWQTMRRNTVAEVKAHLAEGESVQAIRKLTRALLEDPQHPPYHELLNKAAAQRRLRRLKSGSKDTWAELPRSLRQEALQLEAFSAYVDEVERIFDNAGIPQLSTPAPRDPRKPLSELPPGREQHPVDQPAAPSPGRKKRRQARSTSVS
ncbi:hypothetical protein KBY96_15145 [Cyanobium sp. ATX 6A2]|uniref:hypothetical protein n=1 Tax=Cyanobium sp. ATX 6A2 TaxID=2823700 RepID=UPI0020CC106B|nr:hypothetical protein [Cyanobium sp. ATX 6A2]MCP9889256.1 hypothetical protein [Cyanobium sp. ATX 6A2]